MREVRLYGELGRRFGRVHHFAIKNAAEAVRALRANFPGFEREFLAIAERYRIIVGRTRLSEARELLDPSGDREVIRIIPVVAGAKRAGVLQTIIGIFVIAVGVFVPGPWSPYLINAGLALTLGGVIQMLTPVPKLKAGEDKTKNNASYVFSGPINVAAQGNPVPVGYGRLIIGSAVISAGLSTSEYPL